MLFRSVADASSSDDEYLLERARARTRRRPRARSRRRGSLKVRGLRYAGCAPRTVVIAALLCLLAYELATTYFPRHAQPSAPARRAAQEPQPQEAAQPVAPEPAPPPEGAVSGAMAAEHAGGGAESVDDVRPPAARSTALRAALAGRGAEPGAGENFWEWFQAARSKARIQCLPENRRLCEMTYKFVRKYKIRAMYDASCARNSAWMGVVLRKISREIWGFRYVCAEPSVRRLRAAKRALAHLPFVSFSGARWWRSGFPPATDLVFAWDVLAHTAYGRVWTFFVNVRRDDVKYVLVDNYPGILNDPSPERFYLNLRKHPFRFPAAKEVVQNVTEPGETANRQLLFYEAASLPDNLG